MRTITSKVVIPVDRQLRLSIPEDVPPGPAEIVLVIVPEPPPRKGLTAGELLCSPLFGIWRHRSDIGDSVEYAKELRARAQQVYAE